MNVTKRKDHRSSGLLGIVIIVNVFSIIYFVAIKWKKLHRFCFRINIYLIVRRPGPGGEWQTGAT